MLVFIEIGDYMEWDYKLLRKRLSEVRSKITKYFINNYLHNTNTII